MRIDLRSRRAFLQGVGGASLAIPFLSSLVPSKAAAATQGPTRFVMMYYPYGNCQRSWWTNSAPTTPSPDGSYRSRSLSDIPGDISPILGAPFDVSIRKKMAVVRGLDPLGVPLAHNECFATTADCGENGSQFGWQKQKFAYSVDVVLEEAPSFYPTRPAISTLRTAGNQKFSYTVQSWSWTHKGGVIQRMPHDWDPKVVYGKVFNTGAQADPTAAARLARFKDLTSAVNDDFKETLANRRISANDRIRLDNFMSLISDIRGKLDAPVVSCSKTSDLDARLTQLGDFDKINAIMMDMEVAALACGTTKIVMHGIASYGPSFADADNEKWHSMAHGGANGDPGDVSLAKSKWQAGLFAQFIKKLDAVTEPDGNTLLDNTLVLYRSEDATGAHFLMDTPVIVAGGKGKIKTDQYIDYRNLNDPLVGGARDATTQPQAGTAFFGRPYNSLLITVLKAFGLTQAEYTKYPGQDGFGRYDGYGYDTDGKGGHYTKYTATSTDRNAPLPGLWVP
jgi:hypothetical protein